MRNVIAVEQIITIYFRYLTVDILTGILDIDASAYDHKHTAAGSEDLAVLDGCTHVIDLRFDILKSLDLNALLVLAGIAL